MSHSIRQFSYGQAGKWGHPVAGEKRKEGKGKSREINLNPLNFQ